jgi:hypothetical protein
VIVTGFAALSLRFIGPRLGGLSGPTLAGAMAGSQTQPAVLIGMDVLGILDTLVIDYKRRELQVRTRR